MHDCADLNFSIKNRYTVFSAFFIQFCENFIKFLRIFLNLGEVASKKILILYWDMNITLKSFFMIEYKNFLEGRKL